MPQADGVDMKSKLHTDIIRPLGHNQPSDCSTAVQFLDDESEQTTETVSRRGASGLWVGLAGLVIGFGVGQLAIVGVEAEPPPAAVSEPSPALERTNTDQQELNRAQALSDLISPPNLTSPPDLTSRDVADARRMHTLHEVFGARPQDCEV